jgi:hypothetical protein
VKSRFLENSRTSTSVAQKDAIGNTKPRFSPQIMKRTIEVARHVAGLLTPTWRATLATPMVAAATLKRKRHATFGVADHFSNSSFYANSNICG